MFAGCPRCRTRYRLDTDRVGAGGIKLLCDTCSTIFRVFGKERPAEARGARVLVAHDSTAFCDMVRDVLSVEPFELSFAHDGVTALELIRKQRPDLAVIDVALPGMFGFEVCEEVKCTPELASVKIVLIASVHDKTKYKRAPASLYGADDYIEEHHIPNDLAARIYCLLPGIRTVHRQPEGPQPFAGEEPAAVHLELSQYVEATETGEGTHPCRLHPEKQERIEPLMGAGPWKISA